MSTIKHQRLWATALLIVAGSLSAIRPHRASSDPGQDGYVAPEERALATAKRFLNTVGVPIPTVEVRVREWNESWRGRPIWYVVWGGMATVEVSSDTSSVVAFTNDWRVLEQVRRRNRTGRSIFASDDEVRSYIKRTARVLGVPEKARMEVYTCYADDTPGQGDANRAGVIGASFRLDAHGYRFVTPGGRGT